MTLIPAAPTLFHMPDVKQANKVSKAWALKIWAAKHEVHAGTAYSPVGCPFCFPELKPKEA